ncbi:hypothetical protein HX109_08000 [Galbibacter sp. BG1]|uniref:hypothetical protein n=1 Tax=Galbibacter sp. BG1 TaxID=1170699 RepID=UPI0015B97519|nr:hypothetical protein [Galbibacter sp. BG1]QLE01509.1 hypothetical protein HX109_08000 [Galbibacter sp. BG1]
MNIQTAKLELLKAIIENDNADFIQKVTDFVRNERTDFWNELTDVEQSEIKKGLEELDRGEKVSYDSFLKKIS